MYRREWEWQKEGETCKYCIGSGAALGGRCKHCGGTGRTYDGKAREACPTCKGPGKIDGNPCGECGGKGWRLAEERATMACRFCMGSGRTVGGQCKHCAGAGRMELDKEGKEIDLSLLAKEKQQKCPMCLGIGYRARGMTCDACHGTGFKEGPPSGSPSPSGSSAPGAGAPGATLPGPKAPPAIKAPEISQGNPLAQSKFGAVKFCMGCGTGIPPDVPACPKCGKPLNAPTPEAMRIRGEALPSTSPASAYKPPLYCKGCGTASVAGTPNCPKCGKPFPAAAPAKV